MLIIWDYELIIIESEMKSKSESEYMNQIGNSDTNAYSVCLIKWYN